MTDKSKKLAELAALCEAATAPDREMDAVIHFAIKDGIGVGYASDAPAFTGSIDAALTLVPEGWFWRAGRTSAFQAWAGVSRTHPDHCDKNDEFFARREYWEPTWTPVLALASAALRARAALDAEERP